MGWGASERAFEEIQTTASTSIFHGRYQKTNPLPMKVIFLDFDGVLNMGDYSNPWLGQARLLEGYADRDRFGLLFDAGCVGRLQRLVEATGAGIAISSAWRFAGLEAMQEMWQTRALPGALLGVIPPAIDIMDTGRFGHLSRGHYIAQWLEQHPAEHYVILDDSSDFLPHQLPCLVRTEYEVGFSEGDLERALGVLGDGGRA